VKNFYYSRTHATFIFFHSLNGYFSKIFLQVPKLHLRLAIAALFTEGKVKLLIKSQANIRSYTYIKIPKFGNFSKLKPQKKY